MWSIIFSFLMNCTPNSVTNYPLYLHLHFGNIRYLGHCLCFKEASSTLLSAIRVFWVFLLRRVCVCHSCYKWFRWHGKMPEKNQLTMRKTLFVHCLGEFCSCHSNSWLWACDGPEKLCPLHCYQEAERKGRSLQIPCMTHSWSGGFLPLFKGFTMFQ